MGKGTSYTAEFKEQVLKDCRETNNHTAVARKYDLPASTVFTWIHKDKNKPKLEQRKKNKTLEKELAEVKLENEILKELLKKSNQLWLKDSK